MSPAPPPVPAHPAGPAAGGRPRVVLHTRPGCHLCDLARDVVAEVCAALGQGWVEADVDSDDARRDGAHERWTDLVPVVTVDARHHAHFRVDPDALALALSGDARARRGGVGGAAEHPSGR